jgi:hypothetical protein
MKLKIRKKLTLHILRSCWLMADRAEVAGLTLPRPPAIATKTRTIFGGHFGDRNTLGRTSQQRRKKWPLPTKKPNRGKTKKIAGLKNSTTTKIIIKIKNKKM